jgi:hypothetical protein
LPVGAGRPPGRLGFAATGDFVEYLLLGRAALKEKYGGRNVAATMKNDRKPKVSVTLTRTEADWLLNLLDREARIKDPSTTPNRSALEYGFQAASLADRVRAEG